MTTDEKVPGDVHGRPEPQAQPRVGQAVWLRGRQATVVDVATYPPDLCQVVIRLTGRRGQPLVSVPLTALDLVGPTVVDGALRSEPPRHPID